jgi:putative flippase GtrA
MIRRQVSRFLVVGFTTVAIDLAGYRLLIATGLDVDIAKAISFAAGTVFAYFANRQWTFTAQGGARRFIMFCLLYLSTLLVNVGANAAALGWTGESEPALWLAFLIATGISATLNFLGMKFIVFTAPRRMEESGTVP